MPKDNQDQINAIVSKKIEALLRLQYGIAATNIDGKVADIQQYARQNGYDLEALYWDASRKIYETYGLDLGDSAENFDGTTLQRLDALYGSDVEFENLFTPSQEADTLNNEFEAMGDYEEVAQGYASAYEYYATISQTIYALDNELDKLKRPFADDQERYGAMAQGSEMHQRIRQMTADFVNSQNLSFDTDEQTAFDMRVNILADRLLQSMQARIDREGLDVGDYMLTIEQNMQNPAFQLSDMVDVMLDREVEYAATEKARIKADQELRAEKRANYREAFSDPSNFDLDSLSFDASFKTEAEASAWLKDYMNGSSNADSMISEIKEKLGENFVRNANIVKILKDNADNIKQLKGEDELDILGALDLMRNENYIKHLAKNYNDLFVSNEAPPMPQTELDAAAEAELTMPEPSTDEPEDASEESLGVENPAEASVYDRDVQTRFDGADGDNWDAAYRAASEMLYNTNPIVREEVKDLSEKERHVRLNEMVADMTDMMGDEEFLKRLNVAADLYDRTKRFDFNAFMTNSDYAERKLKKQPFWQPVVGAVMSILPFPQKWFFKDEARDVIEELRDLDIEAQMELMSDMELQQALENINNWGIDPDARLPISDNFLKGSSAIIGLQGPGILDAAEFRNHVDSKTALTQAEVEQAASSDYARLDAKLAELMPKSTPLERAHGIECMKLDMGGAFFYMHNNMDKYEDRLVGFYRMVNEGVKIKGRGLSEHMGILAQDQIVETLGQAMPQVEEEALRKVVRSMRKDLGHEGLNKLAFGNNNDATSIMRSFAPIFEDRINNSQNKRIHHNNETWAGMVMNMAEPDLTQAEYKETVKAFRQYVGKDKAPALLAQMASHPDQAHDIMEATLQDKIYVPTGDGSAPVAVTRSTQGPQADEPQRGEVQAKWISDGGSEPPKSSELPASPVDSAEHSSAEKAENKRGGRRFLTILGAGALALAAAFTAHTYGEKHEQAMDNAPDPFAIAQEADFTQGECRPAPEAEPEVAEPEAEPEVVAPEPAPVTTAAPTPEVTPEPAPVTTAAPTPEVTPLNDIDYGGDTNQNNNISASDNGTIGDGGSIEVSAEFTYTPDPRYNTEIEVSELPPIEECGCDNEARDAVRSIFNGNGLNEEASGISVSHDYGPAEKSPDGTKKVRPKAF